MRTSTGRVGFARGGGGGGTAGTGRRRCGGVPPPRPREGLLPEQDVVERVALAAAGGRRRVPRVLDFLHRPAQPNVPDLGGAVIGEAPVAVTVVVGRSVVWGWSWFGMVYGMS